MRMIAGMACAAMVPSRAARLMKDHSGEDLVQQLGECVQKEADLVPEGE